MAQIMVTGLTEVLADHEDKIAAAQAWCVRKNIGSIQQLKEKGDAAVDEFIGAAGIGEFLQRRPRRARRRVVAHFGGHDTRRELTTGALLLFQRGGDSR